MEPAKEPEPEEPNDDASETDGSSSDDEIKPSCTKGEDHTVDEDKVPSGAFDDCCTDEASHALTELIADRPSDPESEEGMRGKGPGPSDDLAPQAMPRGLRWRWWRRRKQVDGEPESGVMTGGLVDRACSTEASETDEAIEAVNEERWAVVNRDGVVVAEDDGLPLTTASVEAKIEQLLTWMLAPAVHGISKLGVPSAVDRADELLAASPGRDVDAAVREVVAGSEITVSSLVSNFCLERIPFLGCPTVLLKNTWGNLRSILIIAALYGHDLEKPRTQHEALLCLVPPDDSPSTVRRRPMGVGQGDTSSSGSASSPLVNDTAQKVAKMMMKGALKRATGLQAAVDCFELAALLYNNWFHESVDEEGYVCVVATPASAAREFFRRRSLASSALLWCSLPLLLLGICAPNLLSVARAAANAGAVFHELQRLPRSVPAVLLVLPGLLLALHHLSAAGEGRFRRYSPMRLWRRVVWGREAQKLQDAWPRIVTMAVFTLHALVPAISAYSAVNMVLDSAWLVWVKSDPGWDRLHGIACMMLGLYSFTSCVTQYLQSEMQDAIAGDSASRTYRTISRFFGAAWAVMRACCILAAWAYTLLALDLAATHVERRIDLGSNSSSALGILGPVAWVLGAPRDGNPLFSEMAIMFILRVIGVTCQQRLFDLLSRREVLLRLIGAERITAQTVCLLLKGVAVACSQSTSANPIQEFFDSVTPPPICCVLVVAARAQALILGSGLAIAPRLTSSGALSLGSSGCFVCGLLGGGYVAHAVLQVWYTNQEDLESPALCLSLLIPGSVSSKAKDLLSGAITGVQKRAVQYLAMGIIRRFIRWCLSPGPASLTNA